MPRPAKTSGDTAIGICRSAGRLACDQPPSSADPKALCEQLTACLENRRFGGGVVKGVILCEPLASETKLGNAPVQALAAVSAIAENAEQSQFHAAYLVGRTAQGWCILDELLDPMSSPNGCDAKFRITAKPASHAEPQQATVSAQRTCYDTRDQQELARGESNVRSQSCAKVLYALAEGSLKRLEFSERASVCAEGKGNK